MSIPKPQLRSSSLPLFMTCGNAVLNPEGLQSLEYAFDTASGVGTMIHAAAEQLVNTGSYDLEPLKQRLSAEDFDRAGKLMRNFVSIWGEAKSIMTHPKTEAFLEADVAGLVTLTGHIDLLSMLQDRAYILDYKAGRQHEDHYQQMAGYAFLVWDRAGRPQKYSVDVSVVYLEDKSVHPYRFTAESLQSWQAEVATQIQTVRYTVSRKCAGCPLQHACPAYRQFMASTASVFNDDMTVPQKSWEQMDPAERGQLMDRIYVIEKAIDRAKLGMRNLVKQKGSVDIGGGKEMILIEEQNQFLDSRRSLPVLKERLPKGEIEKIMRLPLDEVLGAFAKRAAKGQKIKARQALLDELDAAGAVVRYGSTRMWRRPKGERVLK